MPSRRSQRLRAITPNLYVRWGEVRVSLWTHKIHGLTESDFVMAAKIDRVYSNRPHAVVPEAPA